MNLWRLLPALAAVTVAGCDRPRRDPDPGVASELATSRARSIQNLRYAIRLDLPLEKDSAVRGQVDATFDWNGDGEDLVLDFRAPASNVARVTLDGDSVAYRVTPDHIVIEGGAIAEGARNVHVSFTSTDDALNRNDEFLYALFVPDRASTAIPVFEQPDLKARVSLTLDLPAEWDAVANGAQVERDSALTPGRHRIRFAESEPISTYLISFAAGRLQRLEAERNGRRFTMFHRETDEARLTRNASAIFDLHADALAWLEEYTGIPYPFQKFDFFAVPAFQFGGMEHPGAVWYRADGLLLDEAPSRTQELGRASLIAHETAHMWFGDLVTMRWFDDVWMKEVFANFMAAKIVQPAFPDVDHALRFFQAHHPAAYGVDRTPGANAIRQELPNLREAGSLYGAIIYQKAPIVMRQLEALVGDSIFREGMQQYLSAHRLANATWPDLVTVLDDLAPMDVRAWSRAWVEEPGRPEVTATWAGDSLVLTQRDDWTERTRRFAVTSPNERTLRWPQRITTLLVWPERRELLSVDLDTESAVVRLPDALPAAPLLVLPGVDGMSYGRFPLDAGTRRELLARAATLETPLERAVAWQALNEEMLDERIPPDALLAVALAALGSERDELVQSQLAGLIRTTYWRFLTDSARRATAPVVERTLWSALEAAPTPGRKGALFGTIISITLTEDGMARLERIWRKREVPRGFPVSESQFIAMAEGLAIRGHPDANAILDEQETRITNPDRRARQRFMRPALSADSARRDSVFRSFAFLENRRRESWVLDAMGAMHHPLRARESRWQLDSALALIAEIQATGDIFFPLRWLNTTLDGHTSSEAATIAAGFLDRNRPLTPKLRGKVLQATDDLFRAARIVSGWRE